MTNRGPWLAVSALLSAAGAAAVLVFGWDRSFWYDEVFTLGAAAIGRPLDWGVLLRDVHPPSYVLLVRALGALTGDGEPALRLVNLPGALALAGAFAVLRPHLSRDRMLLAAALMLVNAYTLVLALDLRSYFLVLGFAALGQALLLAELLSGRPRGAALWATAAILTALHFFGAAIGLSLLAVSAFIHLRAGRPAAALRIVLGAGLLFAGFLGWAFGISEVRAAMGGALWIRNGPGPYLDFLAWQAPAVLAALGLLVHARRTAGDGENGAALWMLTPPAMVLAAAALISLHTPVISSRNLVVLAPGAVLALALACPESFLTRLRRSPLILLVVLGFGLRYGDLATRDEQMIRWAVETATPPACDGVPLFVKRPDIVDRFAQEVFLGAEKRPLSDFSAFDPDAPPPKDCAILSMGWHEIGAVSDVTDFFAARGVATRAILPPDPRLAARALMTHGFVIERLPTQAAD